MRSRIEDLLTNPDFRKYILNPYQGDRSYWEHWINESPENKVLFEEAKSIIRQFYEPLSPEEFQIEASAFQRRIGITQAEKNDIVSLYETRRPHQNPWLVRIAASIILLATLAIAINWFVGEQTSVPDSELANSIIKKEAPKGQKLTITLQDGSTIKLNSESYITYPREFSEDVREITLSGEAYFDISPNAEWPFVVKANNVWTKVLGTSFNISSYPDECCVKVALVEGKVEVTTIDKATVSLSASEMASVSDDQNSIAIEVFDMEKVTAWKDNRIYFVDATFDEIERTLERWYDVEFIYDAKPDFEGFQGDFTNETLELVLEGMGENKFEFEMSKDNTKVYIK